MGDIADSGCESAPLILVVDDLMDNRQLTRQGLDVDGWRLIEAESGPDALALIERCRPDVVILDIQMPGMDGFGVLKRLHERIPPTARPHVIAATAMALKGDRDRCLAAGADDYLARPYTFRELRRLVRAALARMSAARSLQSR